MARIAQIVLCLCLLLVPVMSLRGALYRNGRSSPFQKPLVLQADTSTVMKRAAINGPFAYRRMVNFYLLRSMLENAALQPEQY